MRININNIRCFKGSNNSNLSPITVLVGENNTGKSTFLAACHTAMDKDDFPFGPAFEDPPYNMRGFRSIAHRSGYDTLDTFSISAEEDGKKHGITYEDINGEAAPKSCVINRDDESISVEFNFTNEDKPIIIKYRTEEESGEVGLGDVGYEVIQDIEGQGGLAATVFGTGVAKAEADEGGDFQIPESLFSLLFANQSDNRDPVSIAPIRSEPSRTYSRFVDFPEHLGGQVFTELRSSRRTSEIVEFISRFGQESGLFEEIRIRSLGEEYGDPFKILVKSGGVESPISEVGYGISQVVPIIAQTYLTGQPILIQQPELHLHPKAQAELGTLFSEIISGRDEPSLILETHSTYIIDRLRLEVSTEGGISSEDVSVLFFEKDGPKAKIHSIPIDSNGNLVEPPDGYGDFFLAEEMKMLGR